MMTITYIKKDVDKGFSELLEQGISLLPYNWISLDLIEKFETIDSIAQLVEPPRLYPNEKANSQGNYLSAVGAVLAKELAEAFELKIVWLREENESEVDNVLSVVDNECSYVVYPISVSYRSGFSKIAASRAIYEKLQSKNLPDIPPGSFYEVKV